MNISLTFYKINFLLDKEKLPNMAKMSTKCKEAINDFLKYGSNVKVNDEYVFNYGKHCGDYDNFKKTFDDNFKNTHEYSSSGVKTAGFITNAVGNLLIGIGELVKGVGNECTKDSITISEKKSENYKL